MGWPLHFLRMDPTRRDAGTFGEIQLCLRLLRPLITRQLSVRHDRQNLPGDYFLLSAMSARML
jgi:hypothetical protein